MSKVYLLQFNIIHDPSSYPWCIVTVCRLLEQERTSHRELKQTWQMANDQFLVNQQLQNTELQRVWSVLSAEQMKKVEALRRQEPGVGQLISLDSPDASPSSASIEVSHKYNKIN